MGRKILAVDDEPEILMVVEGRLKASGFDVITASTGLEALEKLKTLVPALILLDVMMPELDGFGVLERIKKDPATNEIPVVMLTAKGESKHLMKAQELKATDYLIKPFKDEDLVAIVQRYI